MSSPPFSKTRKTKLNWFRDILGRKTSHPSSRYSSAGTSTTNTPNDNAPGFEENTSQDDNSTMSKVQTATITTLVSPTPHAPPEPSDSEPKSSNKFKKGLGVAWNGLETALRILEKSADTFPPLKSFVGGLVAFLDLGEAVTENDEEYKKLATELTSIAETLTRYAPILASEGVSGSVARIVESINIESTHIKKQQDRNKMVRTITAIQDQGDVNQRYRRLESLFRQLQSDINLRNWDDLRKIREAGLLKDIFPVYEARYDSGFSTTINRRGCTAETREKVLNDLKGWVGDSKGAKIYWMNGMAGTGKTTISYTLCQWLKENSLLGGNYFCSRSSALCRNVNNIVPTLAYQLAQYSHSFRSKLCIILEEEPEASKLNIRWQFEKLIQTPLQVIKTAMPDNVTIVIDALDECDDGSAFRLFLDTLLTLSINLPIKFFITSRPEPAIRDKMLASHYSDSVLYLHDIEESIVAADIRKYLTEALGSMFPVPSSDVVEQLVESAGKLFIYAATVVRYVCPGDSDVNCTARLQTVLGMVSGSTNQYDDLDELYTNILYTAINPSKRREEHEINDILLILKTVICTKEPMATQTLASFLGLTEERVRFSLQPLQSVLHTRDSVEKMIAPFHTSFPDFLFDERRSKQFHCKTTLHNELLANCCFRLMKEQLKFNICKLESSFVWDKDVPDLPKRIKNSISPALSYTCRYWSEHLLQGDLTDAIHEEFVEFLKNRLLFWMEVANLNQYIWKGGSMLIRIRNQLKKDRYTDKYTDTIGQLADVEEFITHLIDRELIRSTPHIYISGLAFCPRTSSVYKNYRGHARGLIELKESVMKYLENSKRAEGILSVAYSLDGIRIVSSSQLDKAIRIWDTRTGDVIAGPFYGHTDTISSVAFSRSGTHVASGSGDGTVRVWDACTGENVAGPFHEPKYRILSVALSPNGNHIAFSGARRSVIEVWDIHTGKAVPGSFDGHGPDWESVLSVAFSPDGAYIASGSSSCAVRVWDIHTGNSAVKPFVGHIQMVLSIAFSPTGSHIVSGSGDNTIRVWDTHTGDCVAGPFRGHTNRVMSVAFSPDGTRIVSGSADQSIRVWDALTGDTVAGPFNGHTESVCSVAFSPDGTQIVSASGDHTIRLWDAHVGLFMKHLEGVPTDNLLSHSLFSHSELRNLSVDQYILRKSSWITADDTPLFLTPRRFHTELLYAGNILAITPEGVVSSIDFSKLFIGETWSQCYC
ncbi:hypothetical protein Clacol_005159 [Clathrus columnatus]|uniref:Nephrocystin 3-like N-terminal domain-containing protein n=1 Tax=Clathrus columnatus TaxID=1419009 RepID=A0AAV5AG67_9AGAM|nr:hypothetical protein Clacol_005159 [Clathrus columnatus]